MLRAFLIAEVVDKITMVEDTAVAKEIEGVFQEYRESFVIKIQGEIMKGKLLISSMGIYSPNTLQHSNYY